ncbi:unnamed protein product [Leptosia nina]|uniref:Uncharacterized protein n=1 Tax=Leptosia nina TaxID=320188 RepID=A0AAV1JKL8_9NEOP
MRAMRTTMRQATETNEQVTHGDRTNGSSVVLAAATAAAMPFHLKKAGYDDGPYDLHLDLEDESRRLDVKCCLKAGAFAILLILQLGGFFIFCWHQDLG